MPNYKSQLVNNQASYKSNWKDNGPAARHCYLIGFTKNREIKIQEVEQSLNNRIKGLFTDDFNAEFKEVTTFSNATLDEFNQLRELLESEKKFEKFEDVSKNLKEKLDELQASRHELQQIEQISREHVDAKLQASEKLRRQKQIEELQSKIEALDDEIKNDTCRLEKKSFAVLLENVKKIKLLADPIFHELENLKSNISNLEISADKWDSFNASLSSQSDECSRQLEIIKQAEVAATELNREVGKITPLLRKIAVTSKNQWQSQLKEWQEQTRQNLSSVSLIQQQRQALKVIIQNISLDCKTELTKLIADRKAKPIDSRPDRLKPQTFEALKELRLSISSLQEKQLSSFEHQIPTTSTLEALADLQDQINEAAARHDAIDQFITEHRPLPGNQAQHLFMNSLNWLRGHKDSESTLIDQTTTHFIHQALKEISRIGQELLSSSATPEAIALAKKFLEQKNQQHLSLDDLDAQIDQTFTLLNDPTKNHQLHRLVDHIRTLLSCQQDQKNKFIQAMKAKHDDLIEKGGHSSVPRFAKEKIDHLHSKSKWDQQTNLIDLANSWNTWREDYNKLAGTLKTLEIENFARMLHQCHEYVEKTAKTKVGTLTGDEYRQALPLITTLEASLNYEEEFQKHQHITTAHVNTFRTRLTNQMTALNKLFEEEKTKEKLRVSINQNIDSFLNKTKEYEKEIETLENYHQVKLQDARNYLEHQRKQLTHLKTHGYQTSTLAKSLFFLPVSITSSEADIEELSRQGLQEHLIFVRQQITQAGNTFLNTFNTPKAMRSHGEFLKQIKTLKDKAADLKNGHQLQLKHSVQLEKELTSLQEQHQHRVMTNHSFTKAQRAIQHTNDELKKIADKYRNIQHLPLLLQMKQFKGEPGHLIILIEQFFINEAKEIVDYLHSMTKEYQAVANIPEFAEEIQSIITIATHELNAAHNGLKALHVTTDAFTINELSHYQKTVERIKNRFSTLISCIKQSHTRIQSADNQLVETLRAVLLRVELLKKEEQIIASHELKQYADEIKSTWQDTRKSSIKAPWSYKPWEYFVRYYRAWKSPSIMIADNYTKQIGKWIAKLKKAEGKIGNRPRQTIGQQLSQAPSEEIKEALYKCYQTKVDFYAQSCERELKNYRNTILDGKLKEFIDPDSRLYREISASIEDKIDKINNLKKEFTTNRFYIPCFTKTYLIEELSPSQLQYHETLIAISQDQYLRGLKSQFPLDKLLLTVDEYNKEINEVERKIQFLRQQGQFRNAQLLSSSIEIITEKKIAALHGKLTTQKQISRLQEDLKAIKADVRITSGRSKTLPLTAHQQLDSFLKDSSVHAGTKAYDYVIDTQRYLVDQVTSSLHDYQTELDDLKTNIDSLYIEFEIPDGGDAGLPSKWQLLSALNKQLSSLRSHPHCFPCKSFGMTRWLSLDNQSPKDLVHYNPEAAVEAFKSELSTTFANSKSVIEKYKAYKTHFEEAYEHSQKLLRDGQINHSIHFESDLEKIKLSLKKGLENGIPLGQLLHNANEGLVHLLTKKTRTHQDPFDQAVIIRKDDPNRTLLRPHLAQKISSNLQQYQKTIGSHLQLLKSLKDSLEFPAQLIINDLETCAKQLTSLSSGASVQITNWLGVPQNHFLPLEDLDIDILVEHDRAIKKEASKLQEISKTYSLKAIDSAFKLYNNTIADVRSFIAARQYDFDMDRANAMEEHLKESRETFRKLLNEDHQTLQQKALKLSANVKSVVENLRFMLKLLNSDKSPSIKSRLDALERGSHEYEEIRIRSIVQLRSSLEPIILNLTSYTDKLQQLEDIFALTNITIPLEWKENVTTWIDTRKEAMESLLDHFEVEIAPANGQPSVSQTISIYDLDGENLSAYEKKIKQLIDSEKESAPWRTENIIRIDTLTTALNEYHDLSTKLDHRRSNTRDNTEKDLLLKLSNTQFDLILRAFKNLSSLADGTDCVNTLNRAKQIIRDATIQIPNPRADQTHPALDPWTTLKTHERVIGADRADTIKYILNGHKFNLHSKPLNRDSSEITFRGIHENIDQCKRSLESWINQIEAILDGNEAAPIQRAEEKEAPRAEEKEDRDPSQNLSLGKYIGSQDPPLAWKEVPKEINNEDRQQYNQSLIDIRKRAVMLNSLKEKVSLRLADGTIQEFKIAELTTVEQLLDYRDVIQKLWSEAREAACTSHLKLTGSLPPKEQIWPEYLQW